MPVTFDFDGSLELAAKLTKLADTIESDASARQTPRDAALQWPTFSGPYATAHRGFADDEDAQLTKTQECRDTAGLWASAWTRAVDDHNDEAYELAAREQNRMNEARIRQWRLIRINVPDAEPEPFPRLGSISPPRPAEKPIGATYEPTTSFVEYVSDGLNMVAEYRSTL